MRTNPHSATYAATYTGRNIRRQEDTMSIIEIPFHEDERYPGSGEMVSDYVVVFNGKHQGANQSHRYGVGFATDAVRVMGGPVVPGPYAYTYALATCIDNHGGTSAESRSLVERGLEAPAVEGQLFRIMGETWVFTDGPWGHDPIFTRVADIVK